MTSFYTIGVQVWRFPWLKTYLVSEHFWSEDGTRLTVVLLNGDAIGFPRMDRKVVRVYADYTIYAQQRAPVAPLSDNEPLPEVE
jgi:hypothetical protein